MTKRKKIILVDDDITNLSVGKDLLSENYEVFTVPSGEKLLLALEKILPDLILLDIEMPEMDGYETIRRIKSRSETANIPVIFLTAKSDEGSEMEGLSLGAVDYISKPFSPPLLLKRVEIHLMMEDQKHIVEKQNLELQKYNDNLEEMVKEKTKTILELQNDIIETIAELVECRDESTGGHINRTSKYLKILIDELVSRGLFKDETTSWDVEQMVMSAQLHDVGKIGIADSILRKPGKLSPDEFGEMKKHTIIGAEIIKKIQKDHTEKQFLDSARIFILYHHERWDGLGYPFGIGGEDIPLPARIMAIIDVYDALVSKRSYKEPFSHEEAVRIIKEGSGTQFDPVICGLFLSVMSIQTGGLK